MEEFVQLIEDFHEAVCSMEKYNFFKQGGAKEPEKYREEYYSILKKNDITELPELLKIIIEKYSNITLPEDTEFLTKNELLQELMAHTLFLCCSDAYQNFVFMIEHSFIIYSKN